MLRISLLLGVTVVACACARSTSEGETSAEAPATELEISVWRSGRDGPVQTWTLRCPGGGSLPRAADACERLAELGSRAFAPTPKDVACAQIYGGPQVAEVRGTFDGRPVEASFSRTDACETERWERVSFLFPPG